jgi:hypothetical protein
VQSYWVYELPFARNQSGLFGRIAGGWQVSGFLTWQGGRPFTVFSGFNTFSQDNNSTVNCNGCTRGDGMVYEREDGLKWFFTPEEIGRLSQPGIADIGATGRNFFRGPGSFNVDAAFMKRTNITEGVNLEIRMDMTNLTNTPTFGFPTTTFSAATFGRIRDGVISQSRKMQLGMKINF